MIRLLHYTPFNEPISHLNQHYNLHSLWIVSVKFFWFTQADWSSALSAFFLVSKSDLYLPIFLFTYQTKLWHIGKSISVLVIRWCQFVHFLFSQIAKWFHCAIFVYRLLKYWLIFFFKIKKCLFFFFLLFHTMVKVQHIRLKQLSMNFTNLMTKHTKHPFNKARAISFCLHH